MCRHKSLRQSLCCLLLLCLFFGSSAGLFSANAAYDTIDSSRQLTQTKTYYSGDDGSVGMIVTVTSILPYISELSFDDYMNRSNMVVAQEYIYMIRMFNNTDNTYVFNRGLVGITANRKEFTTGEFPTNEARHQTSMYSFDDASGNLLTSFSVNTAGMLTGYVSDRFQNGNMICLPPRSSVYSFVKVTSYYFSDAPLSDNTTKISDYDRPVQTISISYPESCHVDNTAYIYNDDYNSYISSEKLTDIYNALVQNTQAINSQTTQNATQSQTLNSNITSQTQQQETQYNEFSAGSDSSDSSNINSAISGGTDAVKQKMGLFSFFDGIVNSMSDILTSEHERQLVLPALDVPLPEETVHVWDRKEFDFEELENNFGAILTVVRFATVAVCYSVMISGAYNIFHKFIGVKDGDA